MIRPNSSHPLVPAAQSERNLHAEVSARAQELWQKYGRPEGREEAIWLEAESQILDADSSLRTEERSETRARLKKTRRSLKESPGTG